MLQTASEAMVAALERLSDDASIRKPQDGGWNAAQVGCHVATTNGFLAGLITGTIPRAEPAPAGFEEDAALFGKLPEKITTFPALEPPAAATRADAITNLRASTADAIKAIESMTPERATGYCVQFPMGPMSLYQIADFIGGHAVRHHAQLQRAAAGV
jgi:uncharacterized damage-inducible protein DinB